MTEPATDPAVVTPAADAAEPPAASRGLGAAYRKLFAATTISNIGDGVSQIASPWLASAVTRQPLLVALVAAAGTASAQSPGGFTPLFNGKDLAGWKATGKADAWAAASMPMPLSLTVTSTRLASARA